MVALRKRALVSGLIALVFFVVSTAGTARADFSIKDEKELGEKLTKLIRKEKSLVDDARITGYINSLGKKILQNVEPKYFEYHFYVVESDILNAFAAPAGHVFFYTGLINIFDSEDELAAVISHEIAHVQLRHLAKRISQQTKLTIATLAGILAGVLVGGVAGPALAIGSMAGSTSLALKFSRENEEESDRLGLKYLMAAGYSPDAMLRAFKKMRRNRVMEVGVDVPTYFSTHPGLRERTDYMDSVMKGRRYTIRKMAPEDERNLTFRFIKTKIIAQYGDLEKAEKIYLQERSEENDFLLAFGRGIVLKRLGRHREAVDALRKAAGLRPDSAVALAELGDAYFTAGKLDRAVSVFQSALTFEPEDRDIHYSLARSYQELGDYGSAIREMEEVRRLDPEFRRINYELGVLYGQAGRLGDASYYLGRYYYDTGDEKKAEYQLEKALEYYKDRPEKKAQAQELLDKIEKERKKRRLF